MSIYKIVKSLQEAQGSLAKQAILDANKDNEFLRSYMKAVYDPAINYWQKDLAKGTETWQGTEQFSQRDINYLADEIADRKVTGHTAKAELSGWVSALNQEGIELVRLLLKRSIGASVGDTMVLKTWPDLYFIPPYQRCSLMDDKIRAKFDKLDSILIQPKLDGSFAYLVRDGQKPPEVITRAGSKYPTWFAERLATGLPSGSVMVGEIEVVFYDKHGRHILSRQEGNGILNSILQEGDEGKFSDYEFEITCWDYLTPEEFRTGKSEHDYLVRWTTMSVVLKDVDGISYLTPYVRAIDTDVVKTVEEAFEIYQKYTAEGLEGAVMKNPDSMWKNGTSKDMIKLKIVFEAEYIVTGYYEGEGKAKGMLGGLSVETKDGLLKCNVGTGFSDAQRKDMWIRKEDLIGDIITLKANDVVSSSSNATKSLFLPVFVEVRLDKTEADTLDSVIKQLNSAKGLK